MFAIHEFLHDIRWVVLLVTLPTGLYYSWRFWSQLTAPPPQPTTSRVTRPGAKPVAKPGSPAAGVQQNLLEKSSAGSSSSAAGEAARKIKAQEPTIRIGTDDKRPESKPAHDTNDLTKTQAEDDEVGQLFAGLDDQLTPKPPPAPPKNALQRATRLEELGFHHSIPSEEGGVATEPPKDRPATGSTAPAAPSTAPAAPPASDAMDDSPQLDDILARLDRVLGDDSAEDAGGATAASTESAGEDETSPTESATPTASAAAPATTPAPPTEVKPATSLPPPPPKAPAWARADVTDEEIEGDDKPPGRQLGLFDREKTDPGKDGDKPAT
jgi:hypothetical protein